MLYNVFDFIVVDYIFQIDKFIFCYWYHTQQLYYILCMLHWVQETIVFSVEATNVFFRYDKTLDLNV
jgi:hypothetical protein